MISFKCLIKHKWVYSIEPLTFIGHSNNIIKVFNTNVRLCQRCYKKQRHTLSGWESHILTESENRDSKFRDLGI